MRHVAIDSPTVPRLPFLVSARSFARPSGFTIRGLRLWTTLEPCYARMVTPCAG